MWFAVIAGAGIAGGIAYAYIDKYLRGQGLLRFQNNSKNIQLAQCSSCSQHGKYLGVS
jgi:hypothetical protein